MQCRRLDGFVARCLRRVLGIPAAFISRVSNATVLARAGLMQFTTQLLKQQCLMLGKVAFTPEGSLLRKNVFVAASIMPQIGRFKLKVGRPKQHWTAEVMKAARARLGFARCNSLLEDSSHGAYSRWRKAVCDSF